MYSQYREELGNQERFNDFYLNFYYCEFGDTNHSLLLQFLFMTLTQDFKNKQIPVSSP